MECMIDTGAFSSFIKIKSKYQQCYASWIKKSNLLKYLIDNDVISIPHIVDESLIKDKIFYFVNGHLKSKLAVKHVELALKELARKCLRNGVYKVSFPKMWQSFGWNNVARIINDTLIRNGIECFVFENKQDMEERDILSINDKIGRLQDREKKISDLIGKVKAQKMEGFLFEDGVLLKVRREIVGVLKKLLVVPKEIRPDILKICHDNFMGSHLGEKKT
ncbi:hypothetical protein BpHYR1_020947 [Brachionus plicatilis]|uniref:Uncharacterized protein n=1 Tax=Brachionus plicatilis TaxID=10195 RepID=A0A3M7RTB8_BRAPC|nr:hypothetical protein BpHYR1_020947 [Brachionus plicatilis]